MLLKFYYAENRKTKKLSHVVTIENKYKYIHFYLYNPFGVDFFKFSKKVLEENLPRDPSGEDTAVDVEGDKVIMYDIYFDGDEPDELLEIKKEDLIYILDRWIKFLEKPITDENYEEIFEMEDPVVKVLKDDKYVII
ncbi:DUF5376 family protein [Fusobacterium canifelinum]|uniref:Uncharacterized protein n=1 Tax=Fusobacterium canifelinum TaxID=285729 RepID=A0A3P1UYU3_9FUSO|nr:DUF5376 family protein [Fusobacterium canifelinum]RRD27189.1 hypothetical protein EII27_04105 [Fusobacterium canifelinum]